jgi:hypothetical protein
MPRPGTEETDLEYVEIGVTAGPLTKTIKDQDGAVVDLTNATYRCLVKAEPATVDASTVATWTIALVGVATAGTLKLTLPASETAKMTDEGKYRYDLHVKLPANHATYPGAEYIPWFGTFRAVQIITRSTT